MSLLKKFAIAALALPLMLAGCGQPATQLCPADGPGIGQTSYAKIFNDAAAPEQKVCYVNGNDLHAGGRYNLDSGLLVVEGNVPAEARVNVDSGKLFISGNVGESARVSARVPIEQESYTTTGFILVGKVMVPTTHTHYRFKEFTYTADTDPAVIVDGDVAADARITSNHDIHVSGDRSLDAEFRNSESGYENSQLASGPANGFFISQLAARPS